MTDDWRPTGRNDDAGHDGESAHRRDRIAALVDELAIDEKLRLLRGAPDPEGMATGYVSGIERLGIPPLRLVDGPLGVRPEEGSATAFPASISLAASWNPSLAGEVGAAIAREARAYDQDVLLAPGVNIARVPEGGRNFEYYGENPRLASRLAAEYVGGVQSEGVMATVKHYVANNQETNRYDVSTEVSERALREIYLPAFRAAVEEGVAALMTAYNRVNGVHMSDHRRLVREVLRDEWGFEGFVMSDWYGTESTIGAARAGLDVEMPGVPFAETAAAGNLPAGVDPAAIDFPDTLPAMHEGGLFGDPLRDAIEAGEVDAATVDDKAARVLGTMDRFGLLDRADERPERGKRSDDPDPEDDGESDGVLDSAAHRDLARRAACEGTVLLENDGALPLGGEETIALCGPNADRAKLGGGGSSEVSPVTQVSPLEGLRERASEVSFERGLDPIAESSLFDAFAPEGDGDEDETGADNRGSSDRPGANGSDDDGAASIDDAVAAAETADCAVVVVQDDTTESEDRPDLRLPGRQDELVKRVADVAEQTVVVLRTSGAVETPWLDAVDTVMQTWYPGQADGDALAAVLYGDADPGGRLPVTFGRRHEDYPTTTEQAFPGVDGEARYDEGVFVGYRYFDREGIEPRFPFGHGLSYTDFEYGETTAKRVGHRADDGHAAGEDRGDLGTDVVYEVTVPVRNVGDRAGTEVIQVYVGEDDPAIARPDHELAGFAKVRLEPDERRDVSIDLDRDAFAYYDEGGGWTIPSGSFTIAVGRSSLDVRGETAVAFEFEGE